MKITLIPYLLICWLLVKYGIVKKTAGNFVAMAGGAVFILLMLFTFTRFFAFIDLTETATVKAPHLVLNTPAGGEIDKIFVTHNQRLKAGDPVYRYKTDRYEIQMTAKKAEKARLVSQVAKLETDLKRLSQLRGDVVSQAEFDAKNAELLNQRELVVKAGQDVADLQWKISHALVKAPVDGYVNVQYTSEGQYFGEQRPASFMMYSDRKFIELRIPDQVYAYIKPKAFAEFYVDAYPGKIFRARVQSIAQGNGESQGDLMGSSPDYVSQHIRRNQHDVGRTVILEFIEPEGVNIPIGATGQAWIAAEKPYHILGFLDVVTGTLLRFAAAKSYFKAM